MTIPTLITKYKERVLVNKVKEAHSLLMNAVQLYIAKNYCINSLCLFDTNKTSDKVAYELSTVLKMRKFALNLTKMILQTNTVNHIL